MEQDVVLEIKTTGIEQYLPGGEANMKLLVVGGPGVGKTRWSSYWPSPIYGNVEAGLASVADRTVPYVDVNGSQDMLDFLKYLANECKKPKVDRRFGTAVIDTIDAFQRKVKDEWLQANPSYASFSGYDAWGYLDAKMQMLMTRLLNLDMNVIVLCHYKDKIVTEGRGEGRTETHQLMLQLQGDIKDSAFNDFDLVGWMDTFWKPGEDSKRIEARGITFKPTPDKPFLKDRLHVTPEWLEVEFADSDYTNLFERFMSRVDDLKAGETIGVIEHQPDDNAIAGEGVTGPLGGGPVPPQDPREMPLDQLKKPELIQLARSMPSIMDEVKTNLLKPELIALIEKGRGIEAEQAAQSAQPTAETPATTPAADAGQAATPEDTAAVHPPAATPPAPAEEVKPPAQQPQAAAVPPTPGAQAAADAEAQAAKAAQVPVSGGDAAAQVPAAEQPMSPEAVAEELGATVISDTPDADGTGGDQGPPAVLETPSAPQPAAQAPETKVCAECNKDLAGENQDYVRLSWIKFRKYLCNEHYVAAKKGS